MDKRGALLITAGVALCLVLFIVIAFDVHSVDFYSRPEVVGPEAAHHGPVEIEYVAMADQAEAEAGEAAEGAGEEAATEEAPLPDDAVIPMDNEAYDKHKKPIVQFTHYAHYTDYGIGCGQCHHDEDGAPLTDLTMEDEVQGCIECHPKPSERPKGKGAPDLTESERLEYHAEALHDNCKGCHDDYNKKNNTRAAPTSCSKCHAK